MSVVPSTAYFTLTTVLCTPAALSCACSAAMESWFDGEPKPLGSAPELLLICSEYRWPCCSGKATAPMPAEAPPTSDDSTVAAEVCCTTPPIPSSLGGTYVFAGGAYLPPIPSSWGGTYGAAAMFTLTLCVGPRRDIGPGKNRFGLAAVGDEPVFTRRRFGSNTVQLQRVRRRERVLRS